MSSNLLGVSECERADIKPVNRNEVVMDIRSAKGTRIGSIHICRLTGTLKHSNFGEFSG